jgi:hypothetical protein
MRYLASVPLEVERPLRQSDPDVRSISRLPGFVSLDPDFERRGRYTLAFEVEAGSKRDAMDATDELLVEYENALGAYGPRLLAAAATEAR